MHSLNTGSSSYAKIGSFANLHPLNNENLPPKQLPLHNARPLGSQMSYRAFGTDLNNLQGDVPMEIDQDCSFHKAYQPQKLGVRERSQGSSRMPQFTKDMLKPFSKIFQPPVKTR